MTTYLCHFHVVNGVALTLDLVLETKHYDENTLTEVCRSLADKLGISFVFWEMKA